MCRAAPYGGFGMGRQVSRWAAGCLRAFLVNRFAELNSVGVWRGGDDREIDDRKMGRFLVNRFGKFWSVVVVLVLVTRGLWRPR